jgi:hypothetical protein
MNKDYTDVLALVDDVLTHGKPKEIEHIIEAFLDQPGLYKPSTITPLDIVEVKLKISELLLTLATDRLNAVADALTALREEEADLDTRAKIEELKKLLKK